MRLPTLRRQGRQGLRRRPIYYFSVHLHCTYYSIGIKIKFLLVSRYNPADLAGSNDIKDLDLAGTLPIPCRSGRVACRPQASNPAGGTLAGRQPAGFDPGSRSCARRVNPLPVSRSAPLLTQGRRRSCYPSAMAYVRPCFAPCLRDAVLARLRYASGSASLIVARDRIQFCRGGGAARGGTRR